MNYVEFFDYLEEDYKKVIRERLLTWLTLEEYELIIRYLGLKGRRLHLLKICEQLSIEPEKANMVRDKALLKLSDPRREWFFSLFLKKRMDLIEEICKLRESVEYLSASKHGKEVLNISLADFELSTRAYNALCKYPEKENRINTLGDLANKTEQELLRRKQIGRKTLDELKEILSVYGLKFRKHEQEDVPVFD